MVNVLMLSKRFRSEKQRSHSGHCQITPGSGTPLLTPFFYTFKRILFRARLAGP
jgi:hypothetical protein